VTKIAAVINQTWRATRRAESPPTGNRRLLDARQCEVI